jgi:hypothetical protein
MFSSIYCTYKGFPSLNSVLTDGEGVGVGVEIPSPEINVSFIDGKGTGVTVIFFLNSHVL